MEAVEAAGFDVSVKQQQRHQTEICQLRIYGMVCTACSNGIQNEVAALNGVLSVRVALALGEAEVEFNRQKVTKACDPSDRLEGCAG